MTPCSPKGSSALRLSGFSKPSDIGLEALLGITELTFSKRLKPQPKNEYIDLESQDDDGTVSNKSEAPNDDNCHQHPADMHCDSLPATLVDSSGCRTPHRSSRFSQVSSADKLSSRGGLALS